MEENKNENSKRKFIKKLVTSAAGVVLLPAISDAAEVLGGNSINATPAPPPAPSPSRSPIPNFSSSPSPSLSLSPTPSFSPSLTPTPTFSPSLTPTPTFSPSMTPSPTFSPSLSPSASVTPSVSLTPLPTPSPSSIVNGIEEVLKSEGIEIGTFNPNPTADRSFLIVVTSKPVSVNIDVYDINSRNVFSKNYFLRAGSNSIEVEIPKGKAGYYQVMIDFAGRVVRRRLATI